MEGGGGAKCRRREKQSTHEHATKHAKALHHARNCNNHAEVAVDAQDKTHLNSMVRRLRSSCSLLVGTGFNPPFDPAITRSM